MKLVFPLESPKLTIDTCMDILDWFNDEHYDYLDHIMPY